MYSKEQFLAKSRNNKVFAESLPLKTPTDVGWAMTALFYSALHAINAYLASQNRTCSDHEDRAKEIIYDPKINPIYKDYRDLHSLSQNARYHMNIYGKPQYKEAHESLKNIEDHLEFLQ